MNLTSPSQVLDPAAGQDHGAPAFKVDGVERSRKVIQAAQAAQATRVPTCCVR